jgi:hypothetical protein
MAQLTPQAFVHKWRDSTLKERSAAQEHFIDLCRLIDHPTPAEDDPSGERFTFEAGAAKNEGGSRRYGLLHPRAEYKALWAGARLRGTELYFSHI